MKDPNGGMGMTHDQWCEFARGIRNRGEALQRSRHERGWKIAVHAGISRDMCSVHNASIDDNLVGWCARNPARLKAAKRAAFNVSFASSSDSDYSRAEIVRPEPFALERPAAQTYVKPVIVGNVKPSGAPLSQMVLFSGCRTCLPGQADLFE